MFPEARPELTRHVLTQPAASTSVLTAGAGAPHTAEERWEGSCSTFFCLFWYDPLTYRYGAHNHFISITGVPSDHADLSSGFPGHLGVNKTRSLSSQPPPLTQRGFATACACPWAANANCGASMCCADSMATDTQVSENVSSSRHLRCRHRSWRTDRGRSPST